MSRKQKVFILVISALVSLSIWFYQRIIYDAPSVPITSISDADLVKINDTHFTLNNSWLRLNKHDNWECYLEGNGYERGITLGILQKELGKNQESVFIDEINKNVPSWWFRKFLILGISWFNRDLDQEIPLEYRQEIFGISKSFSDDFDHIGPKYNRIINYHAAHDIGHAVQNMHLVGCTAFGTWNFDSTQQMMLMGRNFDFYFGDEFAKNKVVLLSNPDEGYQFISIGWASFIGVVSGINEKGLGITLNSDKSEIPSKSGTPVSIIARDVLQYASNIEEAIKICEKYTSFVSESFTLSSAIDQTVVVIEKTPDTTGVYHTKVDTIVVTNHFQSEALKDIPLNVAHKKVSESVRRYDRTAELLSQTDTINPYVISDILRDQKGVNGTDIGCGNPLAVNQLLAHHAVIFENVQKLIWVSAYPFQLNVMDAYSLNDFSNWTTNKVQFPIAIDSLQIGQDPFYKSDKFTQFEQFKTFKSTLISATESEINLSDNWMTIFVQTNPNYYETYRLIGNYYFSKSNWSQSKKWYQVALTKEIAYQEDKDFILERLTQISEK